MPDDNPLYVNDLDWKLSAVRKNVPEHNPPAPITFDRESMLMLDIVETEFLRDEWMRIAESYRTTLEVALETITRLTDQNRKMIALIENMKEELILRKPK